MSDKNLKSLFFCNRTSLFVSCLLSSWSIAMYRSIQMIHNYSSFFFCGLWLFDNLTVYTITMNNFFERQFHDVNSPRQTVLYVRHSNDGHTLSATLGRTVLQVRHPYDRQAFSATHETTTDDSICSTLELLKSFICKESRPGVKAF